MEDHQPVLIMTMSAAHKIIVHLPHLEMLIILALPQYKENRLEPLDLIF